MASGVMQSVGTAAPSFAAPYVQQAPQRVVDAITSVTALSQVARDANRVSAESSASQVAKDSKSQTISRNEKRAEGSFASGEERGDADMPSTYSASTTGKGQRVNTTA